jgi:hypothetical protein
MSKIPRWLRVAGVVAVAVVAVVVLVVNGRTIEAFITGLLGAGAARREARRVGQAGRRRLEGEATRLEALQAAAEETRAEAAEPSTALEAAAALRASRERR